MSTLVTFISLLLASIYVVYIVVRPKYKPEVREEQKNLQLLADLKLKAEKFTLDFDRCDFKDSSYMWKLRKIIPIVKLPDYLLVVQLGFLIHLS